MDTPTSTRRKRSTPTVREIRVADGVARVAVARGYSYSKGSRVDPHWHDHAQFLFAIAGTMTVRTPQRTWMVPPSSALWIPAHTVHDIEMHGRVEMRTLFINERLATGMSAECVVLEVTPLLRELIVRAATLPANYDEHDEDGLLMRLLLAEVRRLPPSALDLPLPSSPDLRQLCERLLANFATRANCGTDAENLNVSARTLYRRFLQETGISFAHWKQQARLLEAIRRLTLGASVTDIALDLGYESTSAFSAMFRRSLGVSPRTFVSKTK